MTDYILSLTYFAAEDYNQGAYGAGLYGEGQRGALDALASTGYDVLIPLFLGFSLVIASIVLVVRRLMRRRIRNKFASTQQPN